MSVRGFVLSVFLLIATTAAAQDISAAAAAVSENELLAVEKEIAAMDEAELRSLLEYSVYCSERSPDRARIESCRIARMRYQTEFGRDRATDRAINAAEHFVAILLAISRTGGDYRVPPGTEAVDTTIKNAVQKALQARRAKN